MRLDKVIVVHIDQCGDCGFESADNNLFDYHICKDGKTYAWWVDYYERIRKEVDNP